MRLKLAFASLTLLAIQASTAAAQARYSPQSRPTTSPYLNLLRRDSGAVPNYFTLVRPQQQQLAFQQQQQTVNLQQQSVNQTQQQGLQQVQQGLLEIRQPQIRPTGTGGGFMNFGQYYNFQRPGPRR